jgi:hypothetical protein
LQANTEYFLDFAHKNRHLLGHMRHVAIVRWSCEHGLDPRFRASASTARMSTCDCGL